MKLQLPDEADRVQVSLTRFDVFMIGVCVGMMAVVGLVYLFPAQ